MIINIDGLFFNVVFHKGQNQQNKISVVFFHGFTGNANDWEYISRNLDTDFYPIAIDLIGHGKSSSSKEVKAYTLSVQLHYINEIFKKLKLVNPVIVGYSMGGRLALAYAIKNKANIRALVLESTFFGYKNKLEKEERILNDKKLSNQIKITSLKTFFNFWYNTPLFQSLKKNLNFPFDKFIIKKVQTNNKIGLANSLLGFSSGTMNNYLENISNFNKRVLLITGKYDEKFSQIATEANLYFQNSRHIVIENCGHNVHLEKPEEFLKFLNQFLSNVKEL